MKHSLFFTILAISTLYCFPQETAADKAPRGYLSVGAPAGPTLNTFTNATALTPALLHNKTTNLCNCGLYVLSKSISYATTSANGCPMLRITSSGINLNLSYNCACFTRPASCSTVTPGSHNIGIEVGYSPNLLGSNTQPTGIIIENGIMCGWDTAILIHAGVRDVTIRNMVFTGNVIPIIIMSQDNGAAYPATPALTTDVSTITLENVTIAGSGSAQLACLQWINSYLSVGASLNGGPTASSTVTTTCGYTTRAIIPTADSPTNNILAGAAGTGVSSPAYVYTGIYAYGASNINLKNVSCNDIGYNVAVAGVAENTVAYGMYFRNCRSIIMEDVAATKCKSSQSVIGLYLDNCSVVSIEKGQLSNNYITWINSGASSTNTPEKLWAAGIVLRDSNTLNFSDIILSKTIGYDNAWGIRTILFNNSASRAFNFSNVWIDQLGANNVYGFDGGDLYRKTAGTSTRIAAGSIKKLDIDTISVSSSQGQLLQPTVANEFKALYLGDNSSNITIKNAFIDNNEIAAGSAGINTGIELGASSITASATSTCNGIILNNIFCNSNGSLITTAQNKFGAISFATGGTTNLFQNINIADSFIFNNSGDGIRTMTSAGTISGTIQELILNNVSLDQNYNGLRLATCLYVGITNSSFCRSAQNGIAITTSATDLACSFCKMSENNLDGVIFNGTGQNIILSDCRINDNNILGTGTGGLTMLGASIKQLTINNCSIDNNQHRGLSGLNLTNTYISNTTMNGNSDSLGTLGGAWGCYINGGSDIYFDTVEANFNSATPTTLMAIGIEMDVCSNVKLSNVRTNFNSNAILVCGLRLITLNNLEMTNVYMNNNGTGTTCYGLYSFNLNGLIAKNIISNQNTGNGIYFDSALNNATIQSAIVSKNTGIGANPVYGMYIAAPTSVILDQIIAQNNSGTTAYGIYIIGAAKDFNCSNCKTSANTGTAVAAGLYCATSLTSGNISSCQANANTASAGACYGIYCEVASNLIVDNVTANKNTGTTTCSGISFNTSAADTILRNVQTSSNSGTPCYGVYTGGSTSIYLDTITASSNSSGSNTYGIYLNNTTTDSIMRYIKACNNFGSTASIGIFLGGAATNIKMNNIDSNENTGGNAYGIAFQGALKCLMADTINGNSNQASTGTSAGINVQTAITDSVLTNIILCNNASSAATAGYGLILATARNLVLQNITCNYNGGATTGTGIYASGNLNECTLDNVFANNNFASNITNNTTAYGINIASSIIASSFNKIQACENNAGETAYGIYLAAPNGILLNNITTSGNQSAYAGAATGFYHAAGLELTNGSSVNISNIQANANTQAQLTAANLYTNSAETVLESAINTTNQLSHHFSAQNLSGAYGIFINNTQGVTIDAGSTSQNSGTRGAGIQAITANNLKIYNMNCSQNIGQGRAFANTTTPFSGSSTAVTENIPQKACLFGYQIGATAGLNFQQAYQYLLASLDQYATLVTTQAAPSALFLASAKGITSMYRFIWSTLSQFRRFSTALGIGVFNSNGTIINNCTTVGNYSYYDSAGGIALYSASKSAGTCVSLGQCSCGTSDSQITGCTACNNQAWGISQRGGTGVVPTNGDLNTYAINGAINFAEWLPLYSFLGVRTYTGAGTYTVTPIATAPGGAIPAGSPINGITPPVVLFSQAVPLTSTTTFSWTPNPRKISVGFTATTSTTLYDFSAPAPLGVGILLEGQRNCTVTDNTANSNIGNVGIGVGILADGVLSTMFMNNNTYNNAADALGQAWGIADMELTTPNCWYKNTMYANRVDTYLNYSYLINFDISIVPGQSFPVLTIYPGNISALSALTQMHNIEIYLAANRQTSATVNENMSLGWFTAVPTGYGLMS